MKNKKLVYVLLVISVLVWGGIFVKIYKVITEEPLSIMRKSKKTDQVTYSAKKDSFSLLLDYTDPFFKSQKYHRETYHDDGSLNRNRKSSTKSSKESNPVSTVDWSFIQFKGTIKRKATGKMLTLLNVNGEEYSIEEGQQAANVLLVKNCKDSIKVKYNGVNKYINKN